LQIVDTFVLPEDECDWLITHQVNLERGSLTRIEATVIAWLVGVKEKGALKTKIQAERNKAMKAKLISKVHPALLMVMALAEAGRNIITPKDEAEE